tara:strand:- start:1157 stop:2080 length:924 start_codon:yes stop_codon:yes gene_type:complete
MKNGVFAEITTSRGKILLNLFYKKTPLTVASFIGLCEGKINNSFRPKGKPYFDGLKFHRVIPDFMIQGGCPIGNGTGDPGYKFDDEFNDDLMHNKSGILSMANSGKSTNGSQFFITHTATPWLDYKHTVFGEVIEGLDVVNLIEQNDVMESIQIIRKGDHAKKWDSIKVFEDFFNEREKKIKEKNDLEKIKLNEISQGFNKTKSGLMYKINNQLGKENPVVGDTVKVHYTGKLIDETVFDSSYKRNEPFEFVIGIGQVIKGWDEGILMLGKGDKAQFIIPPNLAYGENGAGGVIPPNATLIFDIELI